MSVLHRFHCIKASDEMTNSVGTISYRTLSHIALQTIYHKMYSKTCVIRPLSKRLKIGFQDQLSLNAGQREHSAILLTCIKLPIVIKIFVLSIFQWLFTQVLHRFYCIKALVMK